MISASRFPFDTLVIIALLRLLLKYDDDDLNIREQTGTQIHIPD